MNFYDELIDKVAGDVTDINEFKKKKVGDFNTGDFDPKSFHTKSFNTGDFLDNAMDEWERGHAEAQQTLDELKQDLKGMRTQLNNDIAENQKGINRSRKGLIGAGIVGGTALAGLGAYSYFEHKRRKK